MVAEFRLTQKKRLNGYYADDLKRWSKPSVGWVVLIPTIRREVES